MTELVGPLPEDRKERQIFITALHAYRNSCQPPELTPGCPFFTWTANGPACGEQCADLLAHHGEEDSGQQIDLGGGIKLVRNQSMRRPRRGPDPADRPFDARQICLSDENRPHADRRTVSLIVELTNLISMPPGYWADLAERSYDIQAVREQLELRGFDVASLIRYGIGGTLPMSITAHILLPLMMKDEDLRPILESIPTAARGLDADWQKYFDESYTTDMADSARGRSQKISYALRGFLDRLRKWLDNADLEDIVMWRVPAAQMPDRPVQEADRARAGAAEKALWTIERFTKSYVSDWTLSSLHLEWLYLHGRLPGPCSPAAMAERPITSVDVDSAIAEETSDNWRRRRISKEDDSLAESFIAVAAGHLRNGKPELAAAIFEALTYVNPDDAYALNNYGFCLITINPAIALEILDKADRLFKGKFLVNLANRVLALHLLGRNEEAYALSVTEEARSTPSIPAFMWLVSEADDIELSDLVDTRNYLKTLMVHIDRCCNDATSGSNLSIT